ncbi:MAG: hypothetical protein Q8N23_22900 [Archangium sp.]|nr:hypothetical protein [Archangium sp.]MDP3570855.1 hypothetical protein [Archangium sp.]
MTRALLSSVIALCACGAPSSPRTAGILYSPCNQVLVAPEDGSTEAEHRSVSAAISLWREVGLTTLSTSEGVSVPVRFADAAAVFHGVYEPSSGMVFINRELDGAERDITVAHELGHALGLPHVAREERASVMNPGNLTVLPSPSDQAALQRLWDCAL